MRRTPRVALWILLCTLPWTAPAAADSQPADDPFGGTLFPPELVLLHGEEIGLDGGQRKAIKEAIQVAQPQFVEFQFELQAELGKLRRVLAPAEVDQDAVLERLDAILAIERQLKHAQVGLLVRIKNLLSAEQQQRLAVLRDKG